MPISLNTTALDTSALTNALGEQEPSAATETTATDPALDNATPIDKVATEMGYAEFVERVRELVLSNAETEQIVALLAQNVSDGATHSRYLHATLAAVDDALCEVDKEAIGRILLSLAKTWAGTMALGPSYTLLTADSGYRDNLFALMAGVLRGARARVSEKFQTRLDLITTALYLDAGMLAAQPLVIFSFLGGATSAIASDITGTLELIGLVYDNANLLMELACAAPKLIAWGMRLLADDALVSVLDPIGYEIGRALAENCVKKMPNWSAGPPNLAQALTEIVEWSFYLGELFGPLVIDILLSLIGVSFLDIGIRIMGKTVDAASDAVKYMKQVVTKLFELADVDPSLLTRMAALVADSVESAIQWFARILSDATGVALEEIMDALNTMRRAFDEVSDEGNLFDESATGTLCGVGG